MPKRFTVVIPSRRAQNLLPCLDALYMSEPDLKVVVVDDSDGTFASEPFLLQVRKLEEGAANPTLFVRGAPGPFCFARNVNLGMLAAGPGSDIILMNDDAQLLTDCGFSRAMMPAARMNPTVGIVSALIHTRNPHLGAAAADEQCSDTDRMSSGLTHPQAVRRVRHHMVAFVCVYLRAEVLQQLGTLDERYTGYGYDDDDYCRRALDLGFELGVCDGCVVEHGELESTFRGQGRAAATDMLAENRAIHHAKYPDWENWVGAKRQARGLARP